MAKPNMMRKEREAYNEALERIRECQRKGSVGTYLDLSYLGLTVLPAEIGKLKFLTQLLLHNNQLMMLPSEIGELRALMQLVLYNNRLTTLPAKIGELKSLTELVLYDNRLTTLPTKIGELKFLTELFLSNNQLTRLPAEIGELKSLTTLTLSNNQLTRLPAEIGNLKSLTRLFLSNNRLTSLPLEIGQLKSLMQLDLFNNQLTMLPSEIGQLKSLMQLDLFNNQLTMLPSEIGQLKSLTRLSLFNNQLVTLPLEIRDLTVLKELYLQGNSDLELPDEVLGPSAFDVDFKGAKPSLPRLILDHYFTHVKAVEETGAAALMEAKVLVLGEASVGKSCLIAALSEGKTRNELDGKGTSGIVRKLWEVLVNGEGLVDSLSCSGTESLRLNFWDFGGQEIYHSAHTLFLTKRAIYLIVVSKRENERQNNVDYWLRMAVSFGGPEAVIYVVVNKDDEKVGHPPDEEALRLKYPQVRGFLRTSCDDLKGIPEARRTIVREALRLEGVRLPVAKSWLAVKKRVEEMSEHTLSLHEWNQLCGEKVASVEARRELLYLCDRLGTVRYFPTTKPDSVDLCETAILNPEWVTLGIYALLDDEGLKKRGGLLSRVEMTEILRRRNYPPEHERIIEEVMRRFDLLYDSVGRGSDHRMLIPLMLPELMPIIPWPIEGSLEFVYQYDVMPAGLVPAFMARMHEHLSKSSPPWRHGCVLDLKQCRVRVIGDSETKQVRISVEGAEVSRRESLDQVRFTFESLHGAVQNLPVQQLIPVPRYSNAPKLDYEFVRSLEWKGKNEFETKGASLGETITVNVREALDGVRGLARKQRDDEQRLAATLVTHHHNYPSGSNPQFMNEDKSIHIGGNVINSQVGQTLTNCNNMIQQQAPGEQKELLEELAAQVRELVKKLPKEKQEEAAGNLELAVKAATSATPNKKWYSVSAEGLLEAAKAVKDFSGDIGGTLLNLGKLVFGDFSLPKGE